MTSDEAKWAAECLVDVMTPDGSNGPDGGDVGVIAKLCQRDGVPGARINVANPLSDNYHDDRWYPLADLTLTESGRRVVGGYINGGAA